MKKWLSFVLLSALFWSTKGALNPSDDIERLVYTGEGIWRTPVDKTSIKWRPEGASIRFTIEGSDTGYIAMAISSDSIMVCTLASPNGKCEPRWIGEIGRPYLSGCVVMGNVQDDCYYCLYNETSSQVQIFSAVIFARATPAVIEEITGADYLEGVVDEGKLRCTFLRRLTVTKTHMTVTTTWNLANTEFNLLFAQGNVVNSFLQYHGPNNRAPTNGGFILPRIDLLPVNSQATCNTQTSLVLGNDDMMLLEVGGDDTIFIANNRHTDPMSLPSQCVKSIVLGSVPSWLQFVFHLGECEAQVTLIDNELVYNFTVWNLKHADPSKKVLRNQLFCKNYVCVFDAARNISMDGVEPNIEKIGFDNAPVSGQFAMAFELSLSNDFSSPLQADANVTVPNYVFAQVLMTDIEPQATNFVVQLTRCWATPDADPMSSQFYPIIYNNCESTMLDEANDTVVVLRNFMSLYAKFKVMSFVWTNMSLSMERIYFHCDAAICDTNVPGSDCYNSGCKRKRRDLAMETRKTETFSSGPIHIITPLEDEDVEVDEPGVERVLVVEELQVAPETDLLPFAIVGAFFVVCVFVLRYLNN